MLRWSPTPLLFGGALITLIPLALTGHSSTGGSHDLATNSLLIHLVAAALWASGIRGWPADESYGPPARTLFCAMGVCQQCAVWIDGVRVEACRTQVRDKLDVRSRP